MLISTHDVDKHIAQDNSLEKNICNKCYYLGTILFFVNFIYVILVTIIRSICGMQRNGSH